MNGKGLKVLTGVVIVMLAAMLTAATHVVTEEEASTIAKRDCLYVPDQKAILEKLADIKTSLSNLEAQTGTLNFQIGKIVGSLEGPPEK